MVEPGWAMPVTWLVLALALLYVVLVAPVWRAPFGGGGGAGLVFAGVATEWTLCVTAVYGFCCCCPFWLY